MKTSLFIAHALSVGAAVGLLAGCGASDRYVALSTSPAAVAPPQVRAKRLSPIIYAIGAFDGTLYGYSQKPGHRLLVKVGALSLAADVYVDPARHVYVSNGGSVPEFTAHGKPLQTFDDTGHDADGIALCPNDTLYVANAEGDSISEYAHESTEPTGAIVDSGTQVFHVACDSKSDLFVTIGGKPGAVDEFPAGSSTPINLPIRLNFPEGIAVDRSDDVVVANGTTIDFYRVGASKPFKQIAVPDSTIDVAFDASDRYVWATTNAGLEKFSVTSGSRTDEISGSFGFIAASPRD
ncbi:MAG: hypothetical protein JO078_04255 [Candidatus Eremiobacteraeota bacterium]|nr:hypothetical protein [Candidatus Eremiobacteraeota bacterium]MBV9056798.1 hypothetical protein [Candidatus Eremiobacteraeota bacterium]MBV9699318.1 hypothetical protein [Candidatus Eremiobacteraeota bacterium]